MRTALVAVTLIFSSGLVHAQNTRNINKIGTEIKKSAEVQAIRLFQKNSMKDFLDLCIPYGKVNSPLYSQQVGDIFGREFVEGQKVPNVAICVALIELAAKSSANCIKSRSNFNPNLGPIVYFSDHFRDERIDSAQSKMNEGIRVGLLASYACKSKEFEKIEGADRLTLGKIYGKYLRSEPDWEFYNEMDSKQKPFPPKLN